MATRPGNVRLPEHDGALGRAQMNAAVITGAVQDISGRTIVRAAGAGDAREMQAAVKLSF